MRTVRLAQLPIPQPAKGSATGNVPLAAGCLAVAARAAGLGDVAIETVPVELTDDLGDTLLARALAAGEPDVLGLSLYLWNSERSLHLAREVKRLSPKTVILGGGPEVGPDNAFLNERGELDVAVTGEAEEVFPGVLDAILRGTDVRALPGVAARSGASMSAFTPPRPATFPLTRFPSPYVDGTLAVDPTRAVYVETVRGCRSHCTFCFYPKSSASLRTLDVADARRTLEAFLARGARGIVFLDPTFNHRPQFDALLDAILEVNRDRSATFFAEVRAEGLTEAQADKLAAAGFTKLEIGLQSVNPEALKRSQRGGSPELVAKAAAMLRARGIDLLVDLIIGLPGDRAEDVRRGVDFLLAHDLGRFAQVFPLSVLPGTAMRASAAQDGLEFDPAPPYRLRRTATMSGDDILATLLEAEDRLDRRLDEFPRPFLSERDAAEHPQDVFELDVERATVVERVRAREPGAQHVALWLRADDLWAARGAVLDAIDARIAVDPHATLDVVLAPGRAFPMNLIEAIAHRFAAAPRSYAGRHLAHRGEDAQHRLVTVLRAGTTFAPDWIEALDERVPVFREMTAHEALRRASRLGGDEPAARIVGDWPEQGDEVFRVLAQLADPEAITFADRALESRWVDEVLRYRETS